MRANRLLSRRVGIFAALIFLPIGGSRQAVGQRATVYNPTSQADQYGNARPLYRERRLVGLFQNAVQREALRGYQLGGERQLQRGGLVPFGLAQDLYVSRRTGRTAPWRTGLMSSLGFRTPVTSASPLTVSQGMRRALSQYGGFENRAGFGDAGALSDLLGRRTAMIRATALDAPIRRAVWQFGAAALAGAGAVGEDGPESEAAPFQRAAPDALSLSLALGRNVRRSYETVRDEGWERFQEGDYWRAARAFETARLLNTLDFDARIGELFSRLSRGSMRTASALVDQIAVRDPEPFLHELNVADRYGDPAEVRRVRLEVQLFSQRNTDVPSATALHAFALWYLGARDEAVSAAARLEREPSRSIYAGWPAKMRAVASPAIE